MVGGWEPEDIVFSLMSSCAAELFSDERTSSGGDGLLAVDQMQVD